MNILEKYTLHNTVFEIKGPSTFDTYCNFSAAMVSFATVIFPSNLVTAVHKTYRFVKMILTFSRVFKRYFMQFYIISLLYLLHLLEDCFKTDI